MMSKKLFACIVWLLVTVPTLICQETVPSLLGDFSQIREIRLKKLSETNLGKDILIVTLKQDSLRGSFHNVETHYLVLQQATGRSNISVHDIAEITIYPGKIEIFLSAAVGLIGGGFGAGIVRILEPEAGALTYGLVGLSGTGIAYWWSLKTFNQPEIVQFE